MTRQEAVEIQYQKELGLHTGMVYLDGKQLVLLNLNYPQHHVQMARVRNPITGVAFWVELSVLDDTNK